MSDVRKLRIEENVAACPVGAHIKQDHPCFFPFGLVLIEYCAKDSGVSFSKRRKMHDSLVAPAFGTCDDGVGLRRRSAPPLHDVISLTRVGS